MSTEFSNDGIVIAAQDLSVLTPGTDDHNRVFHHDGSASITLTNANTTTASGYYLWNNTQGGWVPLAEKAMGGAEISPTSITTERATIDGRRVYIQSAAPANPAADDIWFDLP